MENETKKSLIKDAIINAPIETPPEVIKNTQEEIKKKKIIIIGSPEKVSPEMLDNLNKKYNCEIVIVSREEYKEKYLKDFLEDVIERERADIELCIKRMELMDYLPSTLSVDESPKPDFPRKIGKVNNKKLSAPQKQYNSRKRGR